MESNQGIPSNNNEGDFGKKKPDQSPEQVKKPAEISPLFVSAESPHAIKAQIERLSAQIDATENRIAFLNEHIKFVKQWHKETYPQSKETPWIVKQDQENIESCRREREKYIHQSDELERRLASLSLGPSIEESDVDVNQRAFQESSKQSLGTKSDNFLPGSIRAQNKEHRETDSPQQIRPPALVPDSLASELDKKGLRWEPTDIIMENRKAMYVLPPGKKGVVVGSGKNSFYWKSRGWKTLDIDPNSKADTIADVKNLEHFFIPKSQDYICVEYIPFSSEKNTLYSTADPEVFLQQANKVLKSGGELIIKSAHFEKPSHAGNPNMTVFPDMLAMHGFEVVVEMGTETHMDPELGRYFEITYHAKKITEGVDPMIIPNIENGLEVATYDPITAEPNPKGAWGGAKKKE